MMVSYWHNPTLGAAMEIECAICGRKIKVRFQYNNKRAIWCQECRGDIRWALFCRDGTRCQLCGEEIEDKKDARIDHIVPVAKGGDDSIGNLQMTHARCNARKGSKSVPSFTYKKRKTTLSLSPSKAPVQKVPALPAPPAPKRGTEPRTEIYIDGNTSIFV